MYENISLHKKENVIEFKNLIHELINKERL